MGRYCASLAHNSEWSEIIRRYYKVNSVTNLDDAYFDIFLWKEFDKYWKEAIVKLGRIPEYDDYYHGEFGIFLKEKYHEVAEKWFEHLKENDYVGCFFTLVRTMDLSNV